MKLRKTALVITAALLMAFAACGKRDVETDKEKFPSAPETVTVTPAKDEEKPSGIPETVTVDPAKIVESDQATYPPFLQMLDACKEYDKPLKESYTNIRQQSYLDHWYRALYLLYPKFSGIKNAEKINEYYANKAKEGDWLTWLEAGETLDNGESNRFHYEFQVYSVTRLDPYVVVDFYSDFYGGGAHGEVDFTADVFDTRTGDKVKLSDLADMNAQAGIINRTVAEYLAQAGIEPFEPYDVRAAEDQNFKLTKDGLVLLFVPYEIAPYAEGNIAVPIGWAQLGMKSPLA